MKLNKFSIYLLLGMLMISSISFAEVLNSLKKLTVEYTEKPLGIDTSEPRFAWQMESKDRDVQQLSYQITVKNSKKEIVWNSGKVNSGISAGIKYAGKNLSPSTKYDWTVKVWDNKNKVYESNSNFETSLLSNSIDAWSGAKWIGGANEDLVLNAQYLPVYKISYDLILDKESNSEKASFVFGANDPRLMDKNKNIYNLENKKNQSYIKVELDTSKVNGSTDGLALLNVYRVGYTPTDSKDKALLTYKLPLTLINKDNKYEKHSFVVELNFGQLNIKIDGDKYQLPQDPLFVTTLSSNINLNPIGHGSDYIAFPMLSEIGFAMEQNQKASFSNLKVFNYRAPSNTLFSEKLEEKYKGIFAKENGKSLNVKDNSYVVSNTFLVADPSKNSMPMLRASFNADKKIASARLYITSRGVYEAYINGKKVGNDYFNPGITQYDKNHMYAVYDVTSLISKGSNAIGVMLGDGWWSGNQTYVGKGWNYFGDRQSLLTKMIITYEDGTSKTVVSNPNEWKYYNNGPVVYGNFFQGEIYDATKEAAVKDWTKATYNDKNWKKASEVITKGTTNKKGEVFYFAGYKMMEWADFEDFDKTKLFTQPNEAVRPLQELTAKNVKEVRPGVFVYDMGQNMTGIPKIEIEGKLGDKVTIRYSEVLYPNLPEYKDNKDMLMIENLRGALSQDTYILKGGKETIKPRFTYHGYRYIEITGINKALPVNSVKGIVLSSVKEITSSYKTSNEKVNKLWENITWSTKSNFFSIPTDCNQRNERMGWTGDISVFAKTGTYLTDSEAFLRRYMLAMRDTQDADGRFADIAPIGGGFGGILWGSAGLTVAWESYQQYGDKDMLDEHYSSTVKYLDYIAKTTPNWAGFLGDWLAPEGLLMGPNEKNFLLWEAYYIYDLDLASKMAEVLGKTEDSKKYRDLYNKAKDEFNKKYLNENKQTIEAGTGNLIDNQGSYAIPLALGIIKEENKVQFAKNLANAVSRKNKDFMGIERPEYSLMTGFIGTAWINKALSDNGYSDVSYKLLQNNSYPSWLYSVDQGSTTVWERLDSYTSDRGFGGNNSMNSFNHYAFGAVGAWMYNYSLGIERDEKSPGFKHFILQPNPDTTGKMTFAKGHYDSLYGKIESAWELKGNMLSYNTTVPANTTATLYLPTKDTKSITENGISIENSKDIKFVKYENGKAIFELKSGKYSFQSKL